MNLQQFIRLSLEEDTGEGDHTSLACIPQGSRGKAQLLVKDTGILAGMELAKAVFGELDPTLSFSALLTDGSHITPGMIAFEVEGNEHSILRGERLVLNCMQRMSGIASTTARYVDQLKGLSTRLMDTRKTTPLMRELEKWAVRIGGGMNHRMGLYDMILIKDNHSDYAGGITRAILNTHAYLERNKLQIPVEVETRNIKEVKEVLEVGLIDRIMLDNFNTENLRKAVEIIHNRFETEASGGITLETIRNYAETGVDFISVGALTHSVRSLDLSLKAVRC